ncbi:hypothetical protein, partial [Rhizobium leguminosarum]|uniref:hypothetical protein n=1 Tax=Rhizobium leguminosarum TaxID=384 RepID=UPI003F99888D
VATIFFDTENPINTPAVHNLLDNLAPTSAVTPFAVAATSRTKFRVDWTASDEVDGSGLLGTTIYYRDNGGPLTALTVADDGSVALFTG